MDGTTPGANGTGHSVYSLNKKNTAVTVIRQRKIRLGAVWQNLVGGGRRIKSSRCIFAYQVGLRSA